MTATKARNVFWLGRAVWVRTGALWAAGEVADFALGTVHVSIASRTVRVHHSVIGRDLRVARPR